MGINFSLTSAEDEVAGLIAHGATNREVAIRRNTSVKNIEYHLTNVYRKLDVTRKDLPLVYGVEICPRCKRG